MAIDPTQTQTSSVPQAPAAPAQLVAHRVEPVAGRGWVGWVSDDRSQADRRALPGHGVRVHGARGSRGAADAHPARRAQQHAADAAGLQPGAHHARHHDGLPRDHAVVGGLRELLRAAAGGGPRHGLPAAQRAVVLAVPRRRNRVLRLGVLQCPGGGLDGVHPALLGALHPGQRDRRVDLPHPPDRA